MTQETATGSQAALSILQGCLVVTLQADLYDDLLARARQSILESVHASAIAGVVFDMSSVRVLDSFVFNHLAATSRMIGLLGARAVFVGFQPGSVSALVEMDVDTSLIRTYRKMEEGIAYLTAAAAPREQKEEDGDDESLPAEDIEASEDEAPHESG